MHGLPQILEISATICLLVLAAAWDVRQRRIPNAVTLPAIAAGLTLTAARHADTLLVTVIALVLLFILGTLRMMGQGDVKLIMALTALQGLYAALISAGAAAILIVIVQMIRRPKETGAAVKAAVLALFSMNFKLIDRRGRQVPFAPYILAGYICLTTYRLFLI